MEEEQQPQPQALPLVWLCCWWVYRSGRCLRTNAFNAVWQHGTMSTRNADVLAVARGLDNL